MSNLMWYKFIHFTKEAALYFILPALIVLSICISVNAQETSSEEKKSVGTATESDEAARTKEDLKSVISKLPQNKLEGGAQGYKVTNVYERNSLKNEGSLGDYITVEVNDLQSFISTNAGKDKNIILFINGLPIRGVYPVFIKDTLGKYSKLEYYLSRSNESKANWDILLRRPDLEDRSDKRVTVSIGYEDETDIIADKNNFNLVIFKSGTILIFLIGLLILLVLTVLLGIKTNMLREPVMLQENYLRKPYSLALTQLAFWSFLVIASYFAIFIVTSEFPPITGSVLVLIGISSGTALGSVLINYGKYSDAESKDNLIWAEKNVIKTRIEEIEEELNSKPKPANSNELKNEMEMKKIRYYELSKTQPLMPTDLSRKSKGFWKDLLSDSNGISLYRFQIAIWTFVIGIIFIIDVYNTLSMPQFDNTLLALMGISSGTYLGFKIPEKLQ